MRRKVELDLRILHTVAEAVSRPLDVDQVLKAALEALTQVTAHETSSLHLLSADGAQLYLRGERGLTPALRKVNEALRVGEGVLGRVALTGETIHISGASSDEGIRGFVCVPIHTRGRILGTLSLGRRTETPFDDAEVALVEATAHQIGVALDNARLYSETVRRLEELKLAEAQLIHVEKLSAVGELASGVAHEINNPLTTILGQIYLLRDHAGLDHHVRERLGIIADEAARAAQIVQNLLLFARRYPPGRRPCVLSEQVGRVLDLKRYQLRQDGVQIVTEFKPCPLVWADENQIQQVLLNLIQNAHQALAGHAGVRQLTVRVGTRDAVAFVEVQDTGPGILPEAMSRIFDPFFTTKPAGEGSGLGLSVSYGIVAEHGGTLRAGDGPEGGACFRIELPLGQPA